MSFLKKLFKRGNTFIILLVIVALLGIVGVPQRIGITDEQIIISLLVALAFDTLLERLGYLDRIEHNILALSKKIENAISADELFRSTEELPSFALWLKQHEDIWITGVTAFSLVDKYGRQIENAALDGKRFRVILVNPENKSLIETLAYGSFTYPKASDVEQLIQSALLSFRQISTNTKGALEVRVIDYAFSLSYVIADGEKQHGQMTVDSYNYKISTGDRYHLLLKKANESRMFDFHVEQFKRMWRDAKQLTDL